MSPYNLYKQKTSFTRSIRTLISTKRPLPKEYIQSSRLDQCALQASQSEQYVTMEIPSDLVANWKREGYTHLHLGGVRLILTLHGRKGLPVTARIALLDTRHRHNSNHYPNPQTNPKQELLRLMPLEWLTNYEHFHQNLEPVQTIEATFNRRPNGQVKLSFQTPNTQPVSNSPQLSYTAMITAVQTGKEKKLPIHGFSSEGYPVYLDKVNGHFLWDVPEAHMCNPDCPCLDDTDIDKELEIMRRKKKKKKKSSYPSSSCKSFPPHPPPDPKPPVHPIRSCLMFSSHSYEESFPPLEKQTDTQTRVTSKPFVQSPITTSGQPEEPKQYEAVLNWQTKNAKAQNHTLQQLGKKIDCVATQVSQTETKVDSINSRLDLMYIHLQDRISELDADLRRMINNHIWGPEFNKKEAEIRKLKAELSRIDAEKTQPSLFTQSQPTPVSPPFFETYSPFYTPSRPQQPVYNKFFRFSHLQPTPQPSSPKKARSKVKISEPRPKATSSSSTSTIPPEESPQDHSSDSSEPETHNSCSSSSYDSSNASTNSESEYADITGILMASETADPSASTSTPIVADNPSDQASQTEPIPLPVHEHLIKPSSTSWFTFDDIPRHKWAARLQEFAAWIDLQDRKEYHQMKCCSLKRHLLDAHYKRMSILFYKLNGFNEPSLKHVFIVSLPPELQPNLQRKLTATNLSIVDISLGKIFQMAMLSLDKICEQKEFFKDLMEDKKPFSEACKKPYLKIECKDEKKCVCPTTKKRHFQKHFHRKSSSKKPFRYFKKKDVSQYRKKKSNRCFICKKSGHFARNCPYKPAKAVRLIQHLQHFSLLSENDDVKSNFSVQSTQDDQTAFLIAESSDSEDISVISTVQTVNHVSTIPRPSLKMSILPSKFHKHIPVIGFIDIGADTSMIDPSVLPSDSWEPHSKLFRAVNGETFETTLITKKPIGIQFFPNCIIWKKIVASKLPDKDLLIGFDILHLVKNLFLTSSGVRYKHMFLPYTDTLRLYALSETPSPYSHISQKLLEFYPENHSQFHHPSPLWKNEQFFIHLPFKLNEDINPTKASHPVDHHKTAFCIPDAHYQWTVMPFGLKVATSLFQKAMTKIFSPILHHALVYIDDILLFSSNHESHQKLLLDFFHIVQAHGIMLSEKKSSIGKESIDFLGMVIKDGQYQPGPHIAIELLKFPNTHLNRKQIQQFLGIVNYVRDFIPKVTIHTSQLSRMLKKQCPPWGPAQIEAVKQLKTKKPDRFPNLCMEHLFLTGLTLSSLSISEDELWYMWCLTTLYATKLVFPIKPVLTHLTTPEFSPDLLWTLFEWYSPLTWWRQQLQHLSTFHGLDKMSAQEANMWTTAFIVHRPYFQYPETRDYWTQDMAYEWRTYPHPYTFIHDTSVTSVLKAYLMELNNVPPPTTDIHHTSIGPSHTLEIIPKTQGCTLGSSSSPHGILVMEQRPDYTNVLFQDAQDPWKDFQSLLHTDTPCYTVTNPDSPAPSTSQHMSEVDEEKYQQAEAYLDQRQRHRHKRQYEKDTGDVSPSRYPSTP
ncbi:hypothetical protein KPL70_014259 [Citrus sinensis]|nr:hypothetical protein KPL70_014259 [Citrus sinensis]